MGQSPSTITTTPATQRIRPTPGSSGRRARPGTVSVYCEHSHSIYTVSSTPGMKISDLKALLPQKHCELKISELPLDNSVTLESLGIDCKTLLRMVVDDKASQKSSSTFDSSQESDSVKIIGPKQKMQERVQKPNHESISSACEEFGLDLKTFAVPDLKLEMPEKTKRYCFNNKLYR